MIVKIACENDSTALEYASVKLQNNDEINIIAIYNYHNYT